jgi:hypothetical protein
MNAYELADKLLSEVNCFDHQCAFDAASMLRQQAQAIATLSDRIAELEKCLFQMQNACIDLTKQSVEPVAWTKKDTLIFLGNYEFGSITIQVQKQKDNEFDIPLYTTSQIKELSDEEIEKIYYKTLNRFDFARAILKKASKK